jgi:hypothetical protein
VANKSITSGIESKRHSAQSSGFKGAVMPNSTIGEKRASIGDIKSEGAYSFGNPREKSGSRIITQPSSIKKSDYKDESKPVSKWEP